jgi:hypothetical protein
MTVQQFWVVVAPRELPQPEALQYVRSQKQLRLVVFLTGVPPLNTSGTWRLDLDDYSSQQRRHVVTTYTPDMRYTMQQTIWPLMPMPLGGISPSVHVEQGVWSVVYHTDSNYTLQVQPDFGELRNISFTILNMDTVRNEIQGANVYRDASNRPGSGFSELSG